MKGSPRRRSLVRTRGFTLVPILALGLWLLASLSPPPAGAWRQSVDGTKTTGHDDDRAYAVTVDSSGDVIAAGYLRNSRSASDFTVVKFSGSTGAELWRQEISEATIAWEVAQAVTVDSSGDVIAAGYLYNSGSAWDFTVIKFAAATGAELWRKEIDGIRSGYDEDGARAVTVDASGDVIAAGNLDNSGSSTDFTVIKFAGATGAELWRQEIDGDGGWSPDGAEAVTVDSSGDVIAAGHLYNSYNAWDFTVIKFAAATGAELWRQEINGATGWNAANAVTVDSIGDVIAAGHLYNSGNGWDFTVIKFAAATGAELWRQEINGAVAHAVTVDSSGDVIAAGHLDNSGSSTAFTVIKFAGATGAELWRQEIDGDASSSDVARAVTVDSVGDVIAAGWLDNSGSGSALTAIKFAGATGAELWRKQIGGGGAYAVTLDSSGDVIAAGLISNPGSGTDFAVIKLKGEDGVSLGPLRGRKLLVKDRAGDPNKRKIMARVKDKNIETPVPGSVDDPTVAGAKLLLLNPATSESATFVLPGGPLWEGLGDPAGSRGYRYRDRDGTYGPCRLLLVRQEKYLKAACLGRLAAIPFTLDEATQGSLTVSIQLGNADPHCVTFGGTVVKDVGTANPGPQGIFLAKNVPSLPGDCPAP